MKHNKKLSELQVMYQIAGLKKKADAFTGLTE